MSQELYSRLNYWYCQFTTSEREEFLKKALEAYSFWRRLGDHRVTDHLRIIIGFFQARMDDI